ncbi:DUF3505 domain protein, partial [Metarhizium robertsii]
MDEHAVLDDKHQLLLCKTCGHAVMPGSSAQTHFSQKHQVKGEQLRAIADYVDVDSLNDPNTIEVPADRSEPLPHLKIHDGFSCDACRYLTKSQNCLARHWRDSKHGAGRPRYSCVQMQSWTPIQRARYWIVTERGNSNAAPPPSSRPAESAMDKIISESQIELQEEDMKRREHGNRQEGIDFDSTW